MFNFKNFGTGFKIQMDDEVDFNDDKSFFIGLLNTYISCLDRSESIMEKLGINLMNYEEPFISIIENLIYKHYGELKGDIIIWYVYDRLNFDGTANPIIYEQDGEEQPIIINNPEELWEFFETKIKNKEDNNE
jgi:hypothetical protein